MDQVDSAQLRAARGLLNLTQADLASMAGVVERTIWLFENEKRSPQAGTRDKLRDALEGVGVEFINTEVGSGVFISSADLKLFKPPNASIS